METYRINTGMGIVHERYTLPFLSDDEFEEFNNIGYTGKNLKGVRVSRTDFLNSLGKGKFSISQTKFDNGDFSESFIIQREDDLMMQRNKKLKKILNRNG